MNNVLYEACLSSQMEWIDSFMPLEEHVFSDRHNKKMKALFSRIRNNKYHKLTRNAVRAIIIAAIILSIAITAFAIQAVKAYNLYDMNWGSVYDPAKRNETAIEEGLSVEYIPNGFTLTSESTNYHFFTKIYTSDNGNSIIIEKRSLVSEVLLNTEEYPYDEIHNNDIKYIFYYNEKLNCVVWTNGNYAYNISSDLSKEELLLIAFSTN